jgi:hypothetical protein
VEEDAQSYLICLRQILLEKGIPLALYMDCHGIFRRNDDNWSLQEQLAGEQTPTQVGQALRELGIEAIFALSPQAKGRVGAVVQYAARPFSSGAQAGRD